MFRRGGGCGPADLLRVERRNRQHGGGHGDDRAYAPRIFRRHVRKRRSARRKDIFEYSPHQVVLPAHAPIQNGKLLSCDRNGGRVI